MAAGSVPLLSEDAVPLQECRDLIASLPVDHRVVPVRQYQGFWWPESTLPGVIAVQRHFKSRPDDVFLATYPKSGTTWLKSLAFAVTTRSQYPLSDHPLLQLNPHQCVQSLERMFNRGRSSEIDALPSPRILATHMLHSVLPDSIAASDCRIVYLWRDPKDVIVSAWHFGEKVLGTREYQAEWPVDKVAMAHCEGISTHATIWDHILGYWRARMHRPEKILFLRYEEMLAEPAANLKRMADFLGCPFSPEEEKAGMVEEIVTLCSFNNLSGLAINKPPSVKHFILVHGICQGAWCWYKLITLLRSAGHFVIAVDLGATGVDPQRLDELSSMDDYARPLFHAIASLPPHQKLVLVGHSFGGASVSLAMEKFPDKISVAVFVTAVMPSTTVAMAALTDEFFKGHPQEAYLDSKVSISSDPQNPSSRIEFGPEYMSNRLYQLSPAEDLTLGTLLVRPGSWFLGDLLRDGIVTEEKYGSVRRVFIVCKEDLAMAEGYQRWMIEASPGAEVEEIEGADHMVMLSKPADLCKLLLEIAARY